MLCIRRGGVLSDGAALELPQDVPLADGASRSVASALLPQAATNQLTNAEPQERIGNPTGLRLAHQRVEAR